MPENRTSLSLLPFPHIPLWKATGWDGTHKHSPPPSSNRLFSPRAFAQPQCKVHKGKQSHQTHTALQLSSLLLKHTRLYFPFRTRPRHLKQNKQFSEAEFQNSSHQWVALSKLHFLVPAGASPNAVIEWYLWRGWSRAIQHIHCRNCLLYGSIPMGFFTRDQEARQRQGSPLSPSLS